MAFHAVPKIACRETISDIRGDVGALLSYHIVCQVECRHGWAELSECTRRGV